MQSSSVACANHPYLGAVFTCERCGNFGCETCRSPSQPILCQPCVQRLIPASGLTVGKLLRDSFSLMGRNLSGTGFLLGIALLKSVLFALIPNMDEYWFLYFLLSTSVSSFAIAIFFSWTAGGLLQSGRSPFSALRLGLLRSPSVLLTEFRAIPTLIGSVLLTSTSLFPNDTSIGLKSFGMMLFLLGMMQCLAILSIDVCLFVAPALVVLEGHRPLKAIGLSFRLTRGHRWTLVGALMLGSLPGFVLAVVAAFRSHLNESTWMVLDHFHTLVWGLWWAFSSGMVVLTWMRLTGRVPLPT